MSLWWVFGFLALERLFELGLARRNRRLLLAQGGQEFHGNSYRHIAAMHALFLFCLAVEAAPWRVPLDALTVACLTLLVLLQLGRYWCMASLGRFWNTRIIVLPGANVVRRGPYRFLRHPNYLVVTLEFIVIPVLMRAPVTLVVFSVANALILRRRVRLEQAALEQNTDYGAVFTGNIAKGKDDKYNGTSPINGRVR